MNQQQQGGQFLNSLQPIPGLSDGEELMVRDGGIWRKNEQGSWWQWKSAGELGQIGRPPPFLSFGGIGV